MSDVTCSVDSPLYKKIRAKSQVFFEYRGSLEQGDVLYVEEDSEGRKMVELVWLEGYKSRNERIALTDLLALVDVNKGRAFELDNWAITGHLLPAGEKFVELRQVK